MHEHGHEGHGHAHNGHVHDEPASPATGESADSSESPDISAWLASAPTARCPVCGEQGAVALGGGTYCPACGEISTSPGYETPPDPTGG